MKIKILDNIVWVVNDSDNHLFSFKIGEWYQANFEETVCSCCCLRGCCKSKGILGTNNTFANLICSSLSLHKRPYISEPNKFLNHIRGKVIKKSLRR